MAVGVVDQKFFFTSFESSTNTLTLPLTVEQHDVRRAQLCLWSWQHGTGPGLEALDSKVKVRGKAFTRRIVAASSLCGAGRKVQAVAHGPSHSCWSRWSAGERTQVMCRPALMGCQLHLQPQFVISSA